MRRRRPAWSKRRASSESRRMEHGTGWSVATASGEKGRFLVSTRAFEVGEVILREQPALVFRDGPEAFLEAFGRANEAARALVLRMYSSRLDSDSDLVRSRRFDATRYVLSRRMATEKDASWPLLDDVDLVHRLLLIADLNGHDYSSVFGEGADSDDDDDDDDATPPVGATALFATASKAAHSCSPNARFGLEDSTLVYDCIRPIQIGEEIAINYVGSNETLFQTTAERRATLVEKYDFWCNCPRCSKPDVLRTARCSVCGGSAAFESPETRPVRASSRQKNDGRWRCTKCGPFDPVAEAAARRAEREAAEVLDGLGALASRADGAAFCSRSSVARAAFAASETLSWCHVSVAKLRHLETKLCLSVLHLKARLEALGLPVESATLLEPNDVLAKHALDSTFACVQIGECAALGCDVARSKRLPRCLAQHPPAYENVATVYEAAQVVFKHVETSLGAAFLRRYLPTLEKYAPLLRVYLDTDHDVVLQRIRQAVASARGGSPKLSERAHLAVATPRVRKKRRSRRSRTAPPPAVPRDQVASSHPAVPVAKPPAVDQVPVVVGTTRESLPQIAQANVPLIAAVQLSPLPTTTTTTTVGTLQPRRAAEPPCFFFLRWCFSSSPSVASASGGED